MELTWDERLENLTRTVGPKEDVQYIQMMIDLHEWHFAQSYAYFCPHEYAVRYEWPDDINFRAMAEFIWKYGMDAQYGKTSVKRYWFDHQGGYYYFMSESDFDENRKLRPEIHIINRGKIKFFDFWVEEDLIERRVRCRTRKGAPREAQLEREIKAGKIPAC